MSNHPSPSGPSKTWIVEIADADIPVRLSQKRRFVSQALIFGHKALRTDNDAPVYIGPTAVNGEQANPINEGGFFTLSNVDLFDWFVDGTAGDGLVITAW